MKRAFISLAFIAVGCGGSDDFGSGTGNVPAALMGKWSASQVSGVNYGNEVSSSPGGVVVQYTFLDGGRYIFELYDVASTYTCSSTVYGRETGTASFADATFTLSPAAANLTSKSSCSSAWNYQRTWQQRLDAPKDYQWQLGQDANGRGVFVVVDAQGNEWDLRAAN